MNDIRAQVLKEHEKKHEETLKLWRKQTSANERALLHELNRRHLKIGSNSSGSGINAQRGGGGGHQSATSSSQLKQNESTAPQQHEPGFHASATAGDAPSSSLHPKPVSAAGGDQGNQLSEGKKKVLISPPTENLPTATVPPLTPNGTTMAAVPSSAASRSDEDHAHSEKDEEDWEEVEEHGDYDDEEDEEEEYEWYEDDDYDPALAEVYREEQEKLRLIQERRREEEAAQQSGYEEVLRRRQSNMNSATQALNNLRQIVETYELDDEKLRKEHMEKDEDPESKEHILASIEEKMQRLEKVERLMDIITQKEHKAEEIERLAVERQDQMEALRITIGNLGRRKDMEMLVLEWEMKAKLQADRAESRYRSAYNAMSNPNQFREVGTSTVTPLPDMDSAIGVGVHSQSMLHPSANGSSPLFLQMSPPTPNTAHRASRMSNRSPSRSTTPQARGHRGSVASNATTNGTRDEDDNDEFLHSREDASFKREEQRKKSIKIRDAARMVQQAKYMSSLAQGTTMNKLTFPDTKPPSGNIVFLVQCSLKYDENIDAWEKEMSGMLSATIKFVSCIVKLAKTFNGYIVSAGRTEFKLAFEGSTEAVNFCVQSQDAVSELDWGAPLLRFKCTATIRDPRGENKTVLRGPRMATCLHVIDTKQRSRSEMDLLTKRISYIGPDADIVGDLLKLARGGEIFMLATTWEIVRHRLPPLALGCIANELDYKISAQEKNTLSFGRLCADPTNGTISDVDLDNYMLKVVQVFTFDNKHRHTHLGQSSRVILHGDVINTPPSRGVTPPHKQPGGGVANAPTSILAKHGFGGVAPDGTPMPLMSPSQRPLNTAILPVDKGGALVLNMKPFRNAVDKSRNTFVVITIPFLAKILGTEWGLQVWSEATKIFKECLENVNNPQRIILRRGEAQNAADNNNLSIRSNDSHSMSMERKKQGEQQHGSEDGNDSTDSAPHTPPPAKQLPLDKMAGTMISQSFDELVFMFRLEAVALLFAFSVQERLHDAAWPVNMNDFYAEHIKTTSRDPDVWAGLRVSIGLSSSIPLVSHHRGTGLYQYDGIGLSVARELCCFGRPGEILVDNYIHDVIEDRGLTAEYKTFCLNPYKSHKDQRIHAVFPAAFAARFDELGGLKGELLTKLLINVHDLQISETDRYNPHTVNRRMSSFQLSKSKITDTFLVVARNLCTSHVQFDAMMRYVHTGVINERNAEVFIKLLQQGVKSELIKKNALQDANDETGDGGFVDESPGLHSRSQSRASLMSREESSVKELLKSPGSFTAFSDGPLASASFRGEDVVPRSTPRRRSVTLTDPEEESARAMQSESSLDESSKAGDDDEPVSPLARTSDDEHDSDALDLVSTSLADSHQLESEEDASSKKRRKGKKGGKKGGAKETHIPTARPSSYTTTPQEEPLLPNLVKKQSCATMGRAPPKPLSLAEQRAAQRQKALEDMEEREQRVAAVSRHVGSGSLGGGALPGGRLAPINNKRGTTTAINHDEEGDDDGENQIKKILRRQSTVASAAPLPGAQRGRKSTGTAAPSSRRGTTNSQQPSPRTQPASKVEETAHLVRQFIRERQQQRSVKKQLAKERKKEAKAMKKKEEAELKLAKKRLAEEKRARKKEEQERLLALQQLKSPTSKKKKKKRSASTTVDPLQTVDANEGEVSATEVSPTKRAKATLDDIDKLLENGSADDDDDDENDSENDNAIAANSVKADDVEEDEEDRPLGELKLIPQKGAKEEEVKTTKQESVVAAAAAAVEDSVGSATPPLPQMKDRSHSSLSTVGGAQSPTAPGSTKEQSLSSTEDIDGASKKKQNATTTGMQGKEEEEKREQDNEEEASSSAASSRSASPTPSSTASSPSSSNSSWTSEDSELQEAEAMLELAEMIMLEQAVPRPKPSLAALSSYNNVGRGAAARGRGASSTVRGRGGRGGRGGSRTGSQSGAASSSRHHPFGGKADPHKEDMTAAMNLLGAKKHQVKSIGVQVDLGPRFIVKKVYEPRPAPKQVAMRSTQYGGGGQQPAAPSSGGVVVDGAAATAAATSPLTPAAPTSAADAAGTADTQFSASGKLLGHMQLKTAMGPKRTPKKPHAKPSSNNLGGKPKSTPPRTPADDSASKQDEFVGFGDEEKQRHDGANGDTGHEDLARAATPPSKGSGAGSSSGGGFNYHHKVDDKTGGGTDINAAITVASPQRSVTPPSPARSPKNANKPGAGKTKQKKQQQERQDVDLSVVGAMHSSVKAQQQQQQDQEQEQAEQPTTAEDEQGEVPQRKERREVSECKTAGTPSELDATAMGIDPANMLTVDDEEEAVYEEGPEEEMIEGFDPTFHAEALDPENNQMLLEDTRVCDDEAEEELDLGDLDQRQDVLTRIRQIAMVAKVRLNGLLCNKNPNMQDTGDVGGPHPHILRCQNTVVEPLKLHLTQRAAIQTGQTLRTTRQAIARIDQYVKEETHLRYLCAQKLWMVGHRRHLIAKVQGKALGQKNESVRKAQWSLVSAHLKSLGVERSSHRDLRDRRALALMAMIDDVFEFVGDDDDAVRDNDIADRSEQSQQQPKRKFTRGKNVGTVVAKELSSYEELLRIEEQNRMVVNNSASGAVQQAVLQPRPPGFSNVVRSPHAAASSYTTTTYGAPVSPAEVHLEQPGGALPSSLPQSPLAGSGNAAAPPIVQPTMTQTEIHELHQLSGVLQTIKPKDLQHNPSASGSPALSPRAQELTAKLLKNAQDLDDVKAAYTSPPDSPRSKRTKERKQREAEERKRRQQEDEVQQLVAKKLAEAHELQRALRYNRGWRFGGSNDNADADDYNELPMNTNVSGATNPEQVAQYNNWLTNLNQRIKDHTTSLVNPHAAHQRPPPPPVSKSETDPRINRGTAAAPTAPGLAPTQTHPPLPPSSLMPPPSSSSMSGGVSGAATARAPPRNYRSGGI